MCVYQYTVTELANRSGTTPHAVRYYTGRGLLQPKKNTMNGYRMYKASDISWLKFVHQAKKLGYTLNEIKDIMHDIEDKKSPCPRVREILSRRVDENRAHINELLSLQTRIEAALLKWSEMPDDMPDGDSFCYLIESLFNKKTTPEK